MSCCPKDSLGFLKEDPNYVLKGKMVAIPTPAGKTYKLEAYVVGEGNKAVMMVTCL